jgi:hypothetical protein
MIPTFPPRPRRLRSLALPLLTAGALAAGLGYLVTIWPAPKPFVVPRDRAPGEITLVPLTTEAQYLGLASTSRCLAVLDDFARRPNWQLTIAHGVQGCVGDTVFGVLEVDAAGQAAWISGGLSARPLHLSAAQLAKLHAATALSCDSPPDHVVGYESDYVNIHWGSPRTPSFRVRKSPAFDQVVAFLDDAVESYRARRLAERADFRATVAIEPHTILSVRQPMTVTFDGSGKLSIRLRGRTISAEKLDDAALVDAIDWVEHDGAIAWHPPDGLRAAIDRATYDAGMQD